jgi:hypothetical protein
MHKGEGKDKECIHTSVRQGEERVEKNDVYTHRLESEKGYESCLE